MKARILLAAVPFIGIYAGGSFAADTPLLFGLPFLLVWNLFWMAATAAVLSIIFYLDSRDETAGMKPNASQSTIRMAQRNAAIDDGVRK